MNNMEGGESHESPKAFRVQLPDGSTAEASSREEAIRIIQEYREGSN